MQKQSQQWGLHQWRVRIYLKVQLICSICCGYCYVKRDELFKAVWLTQLVKALAAPAVCVHFHPCLREVEVQTHVQVRHMCLPIRPSVEVSKYYCQQLRMKTTMSGCLWCRSIQKSIWSISCKALQKKQCYDDSAILNWSSSLL